MTRRSAAEIAALWGRHHAEWRDVAQVASQWEEAAATDPALLKGRSKGRFWETLADAAVTLLVSREYEHLLMALSVREGSPVTSFLRLPHPSGLVVDRARNIVHVASTRNPNQVFDLAPVLGVRERMDIDPPDVSGHPLVPVRSRFYPGCLYMHDLAIVNDQLYANAVGENAVARLGEGGDVERAWWPRCIETPGGPQFGRNHLQLNSIAAGPGLRRSFFTASTDVVSSRRPGHRHFAVDRRGVLFSGETREPVARGLTRPHSARLHRGRVFVDDSGYGDLVVEERGGFEVVTRLPGWTRGLAFCGDIAFVGTSRVIPRFRQYAPGLDADRSQCGIHIVAMKTGQVVGSLVWPLGNQIFAIDWLPSSISAGLPFPGQGRRATGRERRLFYSYRTAASTGGARVKGPKWAATSGS